MLEKLKSRKLLIAMIGQVTGILVLLYPEHADPITQAASQLGALALMALTGAGYIKGQGHVDAAEATAKSLSPKGTPLPMLIGATMIGVMCLGGCASSAESRWYQQRDALTAANRVFLAQQPTLSDEDVVKYGSALQNARHALDQAKGLLPAGGPTFENYLSIIEQILIEQAKQESKNDRSGNSQSIPNRHYALRFSDHPVSPRAAGWRVHRCGEAGDFGRGATDGHAGGRRCGEGQSTIGRKRLMAA